MSSLFGEWLRVSGNRLARGARDGTKFLRDDLTWAAPAAGAGNFGQVTVPFATFKSEDSVSVTGQGSILGTSKILAAVYADNDDVYAQDWEPPVIRNVVAGTGFDIVLRPASTTFKGSVKVNWTWG